MGWSFKAKLWSTRGVCFKAGVRSSGQRGQAGLGWAGLVEGALQPVWLLPSPTASPSLPLKFCSQHPKSSPPHLNSLLRLHVKLKFRKVSDLDIVYMVYLAISYKVLIGLPW